MPSFDKIFNELKRQPILYEGKLLYRSDRFPIKNGDTLKICIESTNSERPQGLTVDVTGSCEVQGKTFKKGKGVRMLFWEDSELIDPKNIQIKIFTKIDYVLIYNIWEKTTNYLISIDGAPLQKESKSIDYGHNGAAMIVEEIENGRRYLCNDGTPDDDVDDIVFTVQKLKQ